MMTREQAHQEIVNLNLLTGREIDEEWLDTLSDTKLFVVLTQTRKGHRPVNLAEAITRQLTEQAHDQV